MHPFINYWKVLSLVDVGSPTFITKMRLLSSKENMYLSSQKNKLGSRTSWVPIEQNHKLAGRWSELPLEKTQYQRLVGKLIYVSQMSSNIVYAVQLMHDLRERQYSLGKKTLWP